MATSLKAQEVLDSLIGVLQGQADQLPAIHARLGLPHEALEDDLDHLRKQLEVTITTLVDRRRVEVNEWERRCHAVERDCSALGKCLGGNLALDEAFVTQLHDEPVRRRVSSAVVLLISDCSCESDTSNATCHDRKAPGRSSEG